MTLQRFSYHSRSIGRVVSKHIMPLSWLTMFVAIGVALLHEWEVLGTIRTAVAVFLLVSLAITMLYCLQRAERPLHDIAPIFMGSFASLSCGLLIAWNTTTSTAWFILPLSVVTIAICCSPRQARLYALALGVGYCLLGAIDINQVPRDIEIVRATFIIALPYLVALARQRESALLNEVAAHVAETDAMTTISWSLTTLQPSHDEIVAILRRACPPNVSLALMLLDPVTQQLHTDAAVGAEAASLEHWSYTLYPVSVSIVQHAITSRNIFTEAVGGAGADLVRAGALPATHAAIRSVAAIPLMCQGSSPLGILLAISTVDDSMGNPHHLGLLPVVANQFAISLQNARLFTDAQGRADHDAMTGLYHHRAMHQRLSEEVERAKSSNVPFAIMLMDLDRFKLFNETYGHSVGDRIICRSAESLRDALLTTDILGRYDGDEFLVILPGADRAAARLIAQSLIVSISTTVFRPEENAERMPLTLSVGIAVYPSDGTTSLELIAVVETATLEAKHAGGNRYQLSTQGDTDSDHIIDLRSFGVLDALITAVDHKDRYTRDHSDEVATYAQLLAHEIGLPARQYALLHEAGLLHDVGKVGVPDAVLRKPGKLTESEYDAMKQHVVLSEALLRCLLPPETDTDILEAVRHHHERWDGRGYPRGLSGADIPLIGRVMIVADAVSAMHMDRPYRTGLTHEQIIAELRRGAGTQFDPQLIEPFIAAFIQYVEQHQTDHAPTAPPVTLRQAPAA